VTELQNIWVVPTWVMTWNTSRMKYLNKDYFAVLEN
jgi:hypothetical protein